MKGGNRSELKQLVNWNRGQHLWHSAHISYNQPIYPKSELCQHIPGEMFAWVIITYHLHIQSINDSPYSQNGTNGTELEEWKDPLRINEIKLCSMLDIIIFLLRSPPHTNTHTNSFYGYQTAFSSNHLHDSCIQEFNGINNHINAGVWTNLLTNLQIVIFNPLGVLFAVVLSPAALINNVLTFPLGKESQ